VLLMRRESVKQAREIVEGRIQALREAIRKPDGQLAMRFDEKNDPTVDEWEALKRRGEEQGKGKNQLPPIPPEEESGSEEDPV